MNFVRLIHLIGVKNIHITIGLIWTIEDREPPEPEPEPEPITRRQKT
jgi:hypothetical protein